MKQEKQYQDSILIITHKHGHIGRNRIIHALPVNFVHGGHENDHTNQDKNRAGCDCWDVSSPWIEKARKEEQISTDNSRETSPATFADCGRTLNIRCPRGNKINTKMN